MSLQRRLARQREAQAGVHLLKMARRSDPAVLFCGPCDMVTVLQPGEKPVCGRCDKPLCDGCIQKLREERAS